MAFLKMTMIQKEDDDICFPHSKHFCQLPLTYRERINLEPPNMLLLRLYFESKDVRLKRTAGPPAPRIEPGSRVFNSTDQWRAMIGSLNLFSNFIAIVPNGHVVRRSITPRFDFRNQHTYVQPSTDPLEYDDLRVEPINDLLTPDPLKRTPNANPEEPEARRFIASTRRQFLLAAGHPEDGSEHCRVDERLEEEEIVDMDVLRILQRPTCRRNMSTHTVVNTFDLNSRGLDDEKSFIHVFTVDTDFQENEKLQNHLLQLCKTMGKEDVTVDEITEWAIGEEQYGVMKLDSGLQMSLSHEKEKRIKNGNFSFLEDSEKFQQEKEEFRTEGHAG